ncbi:MAG: 4-hydroxybenzoate octaprenyltransferase [Gammaproteobacteria bacterium]|nr:4-hydroxybenzoate octaprenyltransferase [Pseudomonadales bacterium]MCP5347637.1 4-hydroxybenzoate octaprenyltransferase [Pseudomonadales bacterium]
MSTQSRFVTQLQDKLSGRFPGFAEKLPGYLQLIRFDKPIGVLLLLWPTITALWIAAEGLPDLDLLVIFLLGTYIMRAAGCAINDYADYKFDGGVTRTRERPLATGILRRQDALNAFLVLSGIGFFLVLLTNMQTILLSFGAVVVAAIYPFMKRFTNLPQVILGIAFSWGILMAFTAQTEALPPVAFLLFVANCLWTVAYDTEYAMVDRDDDLQLGIKSTAILFGTADRMMIFILQLMFLMSLLLAGRQLQMGLFYYAGLGTATILMLYQQLLIRDRDPARCFKAFLHNNWVGAALFIGVVLHYF